MKRWLSGLLAALMLFSLTGCGLLTAVDIAADIAADMEDPAWLEEDQAGFEADLSGTESTEDPSNTESAEDPSDAGGTEETGTPPSESGEAVVPSGESSETESPEEAALPEDGSYTTKEDVALYIHLYGRLPGNFITKKEAERLGWSGGSLEPYAPGQDLCIGGNRFGNYEGLLPEAKGRTYTECDIDTLGAKSRGAKRIVFSNDGLIYYTEDHYQTFELLYGDEGDG